MTEMDHDNVLTLYARVGTAICIVIAYMCGYLILKNRNLKSYPGTLIAIIFLI